MANWSNPLITTQYDVFVNEAKDRDVDSATMFINPPTNQPFGSMKYDRSTNTFQEWNGSAWVAKIISVAGGGTGASTPAGATAGLGLGTMAMQNSNAVNISGGYVGAADVYAGTTFGTNCSHLLTTDNAFDLGSNGARFRKGYFRSALVLPVGVDKYATS